MVWVPETIVKFNDNHHHHHKASIGSLVEVVNEMTIIRMNMMEMVVIVTTFILKDNDAGHWSMTKQYKRLNSVKVMMTQKILIMLFLHKGPSNHLYCHD